VKVITTKCRYPAGTYNFYIYLIVSLKTVLGVITQLFNVYTLASGTAGVMVRTTDMIIAPATSVTEITIISYHLAINLA